MPLFYEWTHNKDNWNHKLLHVTLWMPLFMSECRIKQFETQIATFDPVNATFYEWVQNKTILAINCYIWPCDVPFYEWVQNKTNWVANCYIWPCECPFFMSECKTIWATNCYILPVNAPFMSECKIKHFEPQIATFDRVNATFYEWVQNKTIWATNCYIWPCECPFL